MSIASEIERLINAKVDIKLSIENKGVDVADDATLDDYSDYIDNITTGITPSGTTSITTNGTHDVTNYASANVNVQPNLQSKSETITTNTTTTISPDNGYDGLSSVSITTNVSGGTTPTKGIVVNSWDSDGYPTEITTYGLTAIPQSYFNGVSGMGFFKSLTNVNFNSGVTSLGNNAFQSCSNLALTTLPSSITSVGNYCFNSCYGLSLTSLPGVTSVGRYAFQYCTSLKQLSMENIVHLSGSGSSEGSFYFCSNLKAVWLGSGLTSIYRYTFASCTKLQKMYINLPRATVEALSYYQYAFMNDASKTGIIICNDDNDFITKAQFDATDFSTL